MVRNLEWLNVERPIFRNFKITIIKIANDQSFDYFMYEFILCNFFLITWTLKVFDIFPTFHKVSKFLISGTLSYFK